MEKNGRALPGSRTFIERFENEKCMYHYILNI